MLVHPGFNADMMLLLPSTTFAPALVMIASTDTITVGPGA